MPKNPGTVSKILWHFTGGPKWNGVLNRQEKKPKPESEAFAALMGILEFKEVRIRRYKEVIKIKGTYISHTKTGKPRARRGPLETLESSPVCCLADIPIMHLDYHASRYGRMAIVFHRKAAIRHGFSPVLYQLQHSATLQALCEGIQLMGLCGVGDIENSIKVVGRLLQERIIDDEVTDEVTDRTYEYADSYEYEKVLDAFMMADRATYMLYDGLEKSRSILAFIKTFTTQEFGSIYCEREWRATKSFAFNYSDVAMIVLPRRNHCNVMLDDRIALVRAFENFPVSVPIVAWEDLVEH